MKILKILIIILTFSSICSYASDNEFKSVIVGLEVTKPTDWLFITAKDNVENLKRTRLKDAEFQKLMQKYATAPLVAMMKYPEPYDDLNPSFKVNIKPLGGLKGVGGKKIISLLLPQFEKMFKDFELMQAPINTEISGLRAAYVRIHYSLQISDGRTFPATSELWIVPRGDYFFMIGAGTRQDEKSGSREEIRQIVNSLKIDK